LIDTDESREVSDSNSNSKPADRARRRHKERTTEPNGKESRRR
jgi:hypothetical protein